jgi:hypothetical protein
MVRAPKSAEAAKGRHDGAAPMEDASAASPPQPSGGEPMPAKPKFAPLSAYEQSGKRMEFRRVRPCALLPQQCLLRSEM